MLAGEHFFVDVAAADIFEILERTEMRRNIALRRSLLS